MGATRVTARAVSAEEALRAVKPGDRVFIQGASAVPRVLVDALVERAGDLRDVEVVHLHTNGPAPYLEERFTGIFTLRALFVGENSREAVNSGRGTYVPVFLSDVPRLFQNGPLPLDVALLHVSPPDRHGFCSLGISVDCALAAAKAAKVRIAQVNPQMPRTHGSSFVHLDELTHVVDVDQSLPEYPPRPLSETDRAIGERIAALVEDGATLQLGIGGIPNAVLAALGSHRDLGIHSEVVSDGVVDLVEAGVITGSRKQIDRDKIVVAFLNGTRRLYDWADDNPMLEMRPADYTNDTHNIRKLDSIVAINSALEIDLTGQVCAESVGTRIFSGVGGQMDFMRGAALAEHGRPLIALQATARQGAVSRIVPTLHPGAGVTTSRAHVHWVVTEYGCANLHGLGLDERARALIGLAHPAFRDELERAARELRLITP